MQSDFQFGTGEETGLVAQGTAVNEAYLKGLYAGMHFASVSSCWSTPFNGSFSPTPPVENVAGLVPYGNLYGFSPEMETHPEMKFQKQEDRNYTGAFDLQKFSRNGNTGARDEEIYPSDGVSVVDFFSPVQMSTLHETNHDSMGDRFEQHRLFKSHPQTPVTIYSPPLTKPSSSAAKSHFKPVKTTRRSSPKRPSPYQSSSSASTKEGVRRRRLTDKTRCLQNLIPGGDKMDIGTMLQEAYKYIKFLQAQVIVLHSMPFHNHGAAPADEVMKNGGLEAVYGGKLGKLNRQQVLQLMVNSPTAQTILYTGGCCIYSVEQLNYLRQVEEKRCLQITSIKQ